MTSQKSTGASATSPSDKKAGHGLGASFPIVGLGASAGGVEALKSFFTAVPASCGMAYIVLIHSAHDHSSMMPELLQRITPVPVTFAADDQPVEADHVYVVPPAKTVSVYKGRIQLMDLAEKNAALPVDFFLRTLAVDRGKKAVGVILSGAGTDGTLGIREIKANNGLVVVQSEESADYDSMPRSAINTGLADMILPPDEMPGHLLRHFSLPAALYPPEPLSVQKKEHGWIYKIFSILRTQVGHDFSNYKINTIQRRIVHRMGLNHIDSHDCYVQYLLENPGEVDALFREILIGVTSFFRDPESFAVLKEKYLPAQLRNLGDNGKFRVWIPGCSTGEEVYSVAIVLRELLEQDPRQITVQIFGTDIDHYAVDKAREGLYPAAVAADVGRERLARFFTREGDTCRIRKEIRDCVVFSVQDVIKDPPFSRLNLLCCRNLLIYLDAEAQKKVLPLFHFTLKPDGLLMLSASETIGGFYNLFEVLDKKWKIFRRREVLQPMRQLIDFPVAHTTAFNSQGVIPALPVKRAPDISHLTQRAILDQFAPTSVLTDPNGNILYVQGRTGKYLEKQTGPPTNNIVDLAREDLRKELTSAMRTARYSQEKVTRKRLPLKTDTGVQLLDLHVSPQKTPRELAGCLLIVFEDAADGLITDGAVKTVGDEESGRSSRIAELERELQIVWERHQITVEELESSNEELQTTNEAMLSANEALQTTNEELESSKEELQSLNEELQTVNIELQNKLDQLSAAHDDMRNLLNSTEIATVFIDGNLRVRWFTPAATAVLPLIESDIGRSVQHAAATLDSDGFIPDLNAVITSRIPEETMVRNAAGQRYIMRISPYRTTDNRIDGAVISFTIVPDSGEAR